MQSGYGNPMRGPGYYDLHPEAELRRRPQPIQARKAPAAPHLSPEAGPTVVIVFIALK